MKYIYFQRIRLLKNKIAAELRLILKLKELWKACMTTVNPGFMTSEKT